MTALAVVAEIGGDFAAPPTMAKARRAVAPTARAVGVRAAAVAASATARPRPRGRPKRRARARSSSPRARPSIRSPSRPVEGEAEAEPPMVQPELPWHLPLAPQPEAEALTAEARPLQRKPPASKRLRSKRPSRKRRRPRRSPKPSPRPMKPPQPNRPRRPNRRRPNPRRRPRLSSKSRRVHAAPVGGSAPRRPLPKIERTEKRRLSLSPASGRRSPKGG